MVPNLPVSERGSGDSARREVDVSPGSWARMLDRGVRWAVVVPAIGTLAGAWRNVLEEYARINTLGQCALLGLGIVQLVVAVLVLRRVRGWWMELTVVLVTAVLLTGFVVGRPEAGPIGWWPTSAAVLVQCWVLVFGGRHRWWIGGAGVLLFASIRVWAATLTGAPWVNSVGDVVVATQIR